MRTTPRRAPAPPAHRHRWTPLLLTLFAGCEGPERAAPPPPPGDHPAVDFERAKAEAREGAIQETYAEWRAAFLRHAAEVDRIEAAREEAAPENPVRSLDELLRDGDPQTYDPELRAAYEAWLALSEEYAARLTKLRNDPRADPRSPLLPEVRAELRGGTPTK